MAAAEITTFLPLVLLCTIDRPFYPVQRLLLSPLITCPDSSEGIVPKRLCLPHVVVSGHGPKYSGVEHHPAHVKFWNRKKVGIYESGTWA